MIYSMTGFGKSSIQGNGFVIETEIRSVNSRFLDLSLKLPRNYSNRELEIRELVRKYIKRGKISLSIYSKKDNGESKFAEINEENLQNVVSFLEKIKNSSGAQGEISLDNILAFQNYFLADASDESEIEFELIKKSIIASIENLQEMRQQEGEALKKDLLERVDIIKENVEKIVNKGPESVETYFNKIKEKAKQLVKDIAEYSDRLEMELALLAEKADVTEECVRLKSHIEIFIDTLNNSDEVGRKLNFICQEMNREANTINSKSLSTEISHFGIGIKEELEKIREQIQNIE